MACIILSSSIFVLSIFGVLLLLLSEVFTNWPSVSFNKVWVAVAMALFSALFFFKREDNVLRLCINSEDSVMPKLGGGCKSGKSPLVSERLSRRDDGFFPKLLSA